MTWLSFGERTYHPGSLRLDIRPVADIMGDGLRLPFADRSFDGVECYHVLEHLLPWDGARLLAEMARVTQPGCPVEVAVPDMQKCANALVHGHTSVLDIIFSPRAELALCHRMGYTPTLLAQAMLKHLRGVDFLPQRAEDVLEIRLVGYSPEGDHSDDPSQ
jgi:SAM-dependent methyltransferase